MLSTHSSFHVEECASSDTNEQSNHLGENDHKENWLYKDLTLAARNATVRFSSYRRSAMLQSTLPVKLTSIDVDMECRRGGGRFSYFARVRDKNFSFVAFDSHMRRA